MKDNRDMFKRITELTIASLDGSISSGDFAILQEMIKSCKEARIHYLECLAVCISLNQYEEESVTLSTNDVFSEEEFFDGALLALAENEKTAMTVDVEKTAVSQEAPIDKKLVVKQKNHFSKLSVYTLFLSSAAMLLLLVMVLIKPVRPVVGVLTDSIDAEWICDDEIPSKGEVVRQGDFTLTEGFAEITFGDDAVVVVESPAVFALQSSKSMFVTSGKVSAFVPESAIGFRINTINASVVDLGTEFGLSVENNGSCSLHMFKGMARLTAGKPGQEKTRQIVNANEAKSVDHLTGSIKEIKLEENTFARQIASEAGFVWRGGDIDLADIVGGGNGFGSGKLDAGIETNSGWRFQVPDPLLLQSKTSGRYSGGGRYSKVSSLNLVDGVFVPDSRQGPVQVTSAGHTFDGFVDGHNGFWGNIFNGAWHASQSVLKHNLELNGQKYGMVDNPAISIHANQGITFDLQEIQKSIPNGRIKRFTSLFGVSETLTSDSSYLQKAIGSPLGAVDCWVLIDGEKRFNRNTIYHHQDTVKIELDVNNEDRFLTLVVTESKDGSGLDWALFAKPTLVIEMNKN